MSEDLIVEVKFKLKFKTEGLSKEDIKRSVDSILGDRLSGVEYTLMGIFRGKELIYIPAMDK